MKPNIDYYAKILFPKPIDVPITTRILDYRGKAALDFFSNEHQRHGRTKEEIFKNTEGFIIEIALCQALGIEFNYDFTLKNFEIDVTDQLGTTFQCKQVEREQHFLFMPYQHEQACAKDKAGKFKNDYVVTGFFKRKSGVYAVDISNIIAIQSFCTGSRMSTNPKTKGKMCYDIRGHAPPNCLMNPRIYV